MRIHELFTTVLSGHLSKDAIVFYYIHDLFWVKRGGMLARPLF